MANADKQPMPVVGRTDDLRISAVRALIPPQLLLEEHRGHVARRAEHALVVALLVAVAEAERGRAPRPDEKRIDPLGLAALDEWPEVRSKWIEVAQAYRRALPGSNRLRFQDGFGQSWIAATCVLQLANGANQLESALAEAGIETRRWWGGGAHRHAATAAYPRTPLPVTEALANSTVAIPFFRDLDPGDMHQVAKCVLASGQALDSR